MAHWRLVSLGDHCEVQNGYPFQSEFFDEQEGIQLVRVRSLKTQSCDIRVKGTYDDSFLIDDGSLLIGMDGDFQPCLWEGGRALLNQRVCRLKNFSAELDPYFAYVALKEPLRKLEEVTHYTTVKHLSSSTIKEIEIPLPPLHEQRAIAHVLRTVQEAKDARRRELALERERKAALMDYLFTHGTQGEKTKQTDIGEIPESWQLVEAGAVADIGNGSTPSRKDGRYWDGGTIPWITSTKVHEVVIKDADELVTETARTECHLPLVPRNSIVVAITGQGKTLGNSAILELDTCINQHLAYIHFTDESVHPLFALFYLRSRYQYLRSISAGGGSTKGALTCGFLKRLKIPVPTSEEQDAIAQVLSGCEMKSACLEKEVELLDEFFAAALAELMSGRLDANKGIAN